MLSRKGLGSYSEIMNTWTLDDYKICLESLQKWPMA